jgi:nitrite reductase/ring-hydroxylating ferredoxin subunit
LAAGAGTRVSEVVVCAADQLAPGEMVPARLEDRTPIVVVRTLDGELHGLVDRCLHQGARLSGGHLLASTGAVLRCPWHGYEYDVRSGCALFDRRQRLQRVGVRVRDGLIVAGHRSPP